ncbi:N-acetylated-alpha-linked acidic dipeptidase [Rhizomicrobium palustre]|uniref:N-acetylated-alpha-linked acidic dipeptidase n=1 Tax=Rhizomicrobium palustre TaxID=189966 RepID=A0A846MUV2_9PROT|nr:transferrin receptor-like dimerization domain-containing protein [Rhizomicrobium palustre]NIK87005.1 N-acetylated-alpha-linked acidic dipeptidase [Rhizomicrobium palustre]
MRKILAITAFLLSTTAAIAEPGLPEKLDASISPTEMGQWMKFLTNEPSQVSSPFNKTIADWTLAKFKSFGWDAHIEKYDVLYPTPISESVELISAKKVFKATLNEPWTKETPKPKDKWLPAYVAYQGDGDVTAPLVYVNYGMKDDYEALARMGISVKGKIVIARYGQGWRGLKPRLAQEHGAIGCLIYSDPRDDGYSVDSVYPKGPARPAGGFQRGSVQDITISSGDPLTPGFVAGPSKPRLTRETAPNILKIPTLPISYGDAKVLLASLNGQVVPPNWRGGLPITYRVGPSTATVHLAVKSDWSLKTVYDVIAKIDGSTYPDQWVIRGNHHDGWVFGATDPQAGHIAVLAEAKAIGELVKSGWKPKRTIIYTSWDGEEPGLLGSTEWAEDHADELKAKTVLYINSDTNARGFLEAAGSQDFSAFVGAAAASVTDPETKVSVDARLRAKLRLGEGRDKEEAKLAAKAAADPKAVVPIEALGTGSDYTGFLQHLGIPALDLGYGGEAIWGGIYHSIYDSYDHHARFVDPGFVYDALLAKTAGRMVLAAADSDLPLQRPKAFADSVALYVKQVKHLANEKREAAEHQAGLLKDGVFALTADPTKPSAPPRALAPVPEIDFAPLDAASDKLTVSAKAYEAALDKAGASLSQAKREKLFGVMLTIDQTLAPEDGLPGRPWYKHLIYAPGRQTGYGVKTLPAVREGIEEENWAETKTYIPVTARALLAYATRLDAATALLSEP